MSKDACANKGFVAVKFVCGSDSTAGQFPKGGAVLPRENLHLYYPTDQKKTGIVTMEDSERISSNQSDESNDISFE